MAISHESFSSSWKSLIWAQGRAQAIKRDLSISAAKLKWFNLVLISTESRSIQIASSKVVMSRLPTVASQFTFWLIKSLYQISLQITSRHCLLIWFVPNWLRQMWKGGFSVTLKVHHFYNSLDSIRFAADFCFMLRQRMKIQFAVDSLKLLLASFVIGWSRAFKLIEKFVT